MDRKSFSQTGVAGGGMHGIMELGFLTKECLKAVHGPCAETTCVRMCLNLIDGASFLALNRGLDGM